MNTKSNFWLSEKNQTIVLLGLSALMIFISVYLTLYFFEVRYLKGLSGGSICNINDFLNCDKITNSKLAAPFQIPTSVLGGLVGLFLLIGVLYKNEKYQNILYSVLILNFAGCFVLFSYSLLFLQSICLFCFFYYLILGAALFIYFKKGLRFKSEIGILIFFLLATAIGAGAVRQVVISKQTEIE